MKTIGVYKIENVVNGKIYVGQSNWLKKRLANHKNLLANKKHQNIHLQRAWDKYGEENFIFEIIELCDVEQLDEKEIFWINHYDSFNNGYNQTIGGGGMRGIVVSESTKKKMSENHADFSGKNNPMFGRSVASFMSEENIKIWKENISNSISGEKNHFYGKHHSEETRRKISKSNKGRLSGENNPNFGKTMSEELRIRLSERSKLRVGSKNPNSKPVVCLNTKKTYDTIKEASIDYCVSYTSITRNCNLVTNAVKTEKGYIVFVYSHIYNYMLDNSVDIEKYVSEKICLYEKSKSGCNNPNSKAVKCTEDDLMFESASLAGKYYNIDNSSISKNCKGKIGYCLDRNRCIKLHFTYI